MNGPKIALLFFSILFILVPGVFCQDKLPLQNHRITEWFPQDLVQTKTNGIRISGNPQFVTSKYGKALHFNGSTDGIFLNEMPLANLNKFTIEVLFYPESGGNFEQRFFHSGEIRGDRVLLEIRSTATGWYFDAFVQSGTQKMTLIEPRFLHPLDQWTHVAYVVDQGKLSTYVNGQKELEGAITFSPVQTGKTSVGVRLNEQSWFKGAISQIRISPQALKPQEFLNL